MKLTTHTERIRGGRSKDLAGREVESTPEFDLRGIILEKAQMLRKEILTEEQLSGDGNKSLLYPLANLQLLEEVLDVDILGAEKDRLYDLARTVAVKIPEEEKEIIISESARAIPQVGWIQLFPDQRKMIEVSDDILDRAKQTLRNKKSNQNIIPFLVILDVLRPDKHAALAAEVDADYFQPTWNDREQVFSGRKGDQLGFFLGKYAYFLLLHPEERARFTLTEAEKQGLLRGIQAGRYPDSQAANILKNAAIVLGESAKIDERGKIQVTWPKSPIAKKEPLPVREQV